MTRSRIAIACFVVACAAGSSVHAATEATLTGGRRALLKNAFGVDDDSATFTFLRDEALVGGPSPICPAVSKVRFATSGGALAEVNLPCRNWIYDGPTAYRYVDGTGGAGGVRSIFYQPAKGKLVIKAKGPGYTALVGPVAWVEARLSIGANRWCGRFENLKKNDASAIRGGKPTVACATCGDGVRQGAELCDDGNLNNGDGCDSNCRPTGCGNGVRTAGELCDDGNATSGDGCDANCKPTGCGNGVRTGTEACDDGNLVSGDGCDANCTPTGCGNGIRAGAEACDDGNRNPGDGCRTDCTIEVCGDGRVDPQEGCDDGNAVGGDGCRADCTPEVCGDGIVDPQEDCEDGNTENGDCCSTSCLYEPTGSACNDGSFCTTGDACELGVCAGVPVSPWINEFDYDGGSTGGTPDRDEFVEIAAPAGTDLGNYSIVAVEGNALCLTGRTGVANGGANLAVTIPPGTVVGDDTGAGIGFVVVCFQNTSTNLVVAGRCDLLLPATGTASNLGDGEASNLGLQSCPDGVLLRDGANAVRDAVSYEGVVPPVGVFGAFFNAPPYSAGQDQGMKLGVSLEKTTSNLGRATSASEWRLSGGCTDAGANDATCTENAASAGAANPGQVFRCAEVVCGDGVVGVGEQCDEGEANSDAPDAPCRTDCRLPVCGDGVVDPGNGEECEADADCDAGFACLGCGCVTQFDFTVVPGPSESDPPDDGESSLLRVSPIFGITNATQGDFNPGPLTIARGEPGPDGKAELILLGTAYVGARLPSAGGSGRACFRIQQDPDALGSIDCDGGTNYDVQLSVDSNGSGANGSTELSVGTGTTDSGAGAGVLRIVLTGATTSDDTTPCSAANYVVAPIKSAFTTARATTEIKNSRQGGTVTVIQAGLPYACDPWSTDGPASIAMPNASLDFVLPYGLGTQDVAQVLRLNDE